MQKDLNLLSFDPIFLVNDDIMNDDDLDPDTEESAETEEGDNDWAMGDDSGDTVE